LERGEEYPCTNLWYETKYACSDDMMDCLLELHHTRVATGMDIDDHLSHEVKQTSTVYDTPDQATERMKWHY
jgi:hypothetical protein